MNSGFRHTRAVCVLAVISAVAVLGNAQSTAPIPRHGKLKALFNGKDLSGFDTFLEKHGVNSTPDKIFQVESGTLHISGAEFGGLVTKKERDLVYHGRIDNLYQDFGKARVATTHELADAIEAASQGVAPTSVAAEGVGCFISDLK